MLARTSLLLAMALVATGCGGKEAGGVKGAGQKVGETILDFGSGIGKGIDKRMEVVVDLAADVKALGLSTTVAKSMTIEPSKPKGISVYFVASKPVKAKLMAKALNAAGEEIGRTVVDVDMAADDAKYLNFSFPPEMDSQLVEKYQIGLKAGE